MTRWPIGPRIVWGGIAALVAVVLLVVLSGAPRAPRSTVLPATPPVASAPVAGFGTGGLDVARATTRMAVALVLVVGLILGAAALVRRSGRLGVGRSGGGLEVVDCCQLAPKRALYCVRAGDRVVVLGVTESGITPVLELSAEERRSLYPEGSERGGAGGFRSLLHGVTARAGGA